MNWSTLLELDVWKLKDYIIEIVTAFIALSGFATFFYKRGRSAGNSQDKSKISELAKKNSYLSQTNSQFENRFSNLEQTVGDSRQFWLKTPELPFDTALHQQLLTIAQLVRPTFSLLATRAQFIFRRNRRNTGCQMFCAPMMTISP